MKLDARLTVTKIFILRKLSHLVLIELAGLNDI